jgi:hypothetical protein
MARFSASKANTSMEHKQDAVVTDYKGIDQEGPGPVIFMCTLLLLFLIAIVYVGISSF